MKAVINFLLVISVLLVSGCINQKKASIQAAAVGPPIKSNTINIGTKITKKITKAQIDFINSHYDYVITPFLGTGNVRDSIKGPRLFLYRSIQGTWTNFNQFDWKYIDEHENMFCHNNGKRIKTIWDSWLMDPKDLVDGDAYDALDHWVNYYALTASEQVNNFNYDGLFIDSAGHRLWSGAVYGLLPEGYKDVNWRKDRSEALKFIKSYLPDRMVIFNGLHSQNGAEQSLQFTDGGMWETFAFNPRTGKYFGKAKWKEVIELAERNKEDKLISIVSKKKSMSSNIQSRMFVFTSYLLICNQNVILSIVDTDYGYGGELLYYPEYGIDLGSPCGSYKIRERGIYEREFDKGLVLVNPDEDESKTVDLKGIYYMAVPLGGGLIEEDGTCEGSIAYEKVSRKIELKPVSAVLLVY